MSLFNVALVGVSVLLWLFGLADQLHSLDSAAKYLGISALMLAVARL